MADELCSFSLTIWSLNQTHIWHLASWSAGNLIPLSMITPFIMPCSKYRRNIIKLRDAIQQSYILKSSHRGEKVNKNHWDLNCSAFCQRKFCVRLYFQRAENVLVGRSLNPNQLCCQNTIKTIWSPLCLLLRSQSLSKLSVLDQPRLRFQRASVSFRIKMSLL